MVGLQVDLVNKVCMIEVKQLQNDEITLPDLVWEELTGISEVIDDVLYERCLRTR